MAAVIVAGALANKPGNGGGAWERMSWVVGLRRLGFDVYFIEQIDPAVCVNSAGDSIGLPDSVNADWFRSVTEWFGIADRAALVCGNGRVFGEVTWPHLLDACASSSLLVNLSGHLTLESLLMRCRRKAYVDVDPGFTQFWHVDPSVPFQLQGHDDYFTIGENIGQQGCTIPTGVIDWRPVRQPVVLNDWPEMEPTTLDRFTTISSWRGAFGPVVFQDRTYRVKAHEFRNYLDLPRLIAESCSGRKEFEIALEIAPADGRDLAALQESGWRIANPGVVAGTPARFQKYIQQSSAEFSVAQEIYVETNSGWFSDRTVRYLASGKPALVQETGFSRNLPVGRGLVSFRTLAEAVSGAESIAADYASHCRAARKIAEEYFDSSQVLSRMLDDIGIHC